MSLLSLNLDELPELDAPFAIVDPAEIAESTETGLLPSLIYVEGEGALYLDDEESDLAIATLDDRTLTIIAGLVELGLNKIRHEQAVRRIAKTRAVAGTYSVGE
jgi:hypothetical protein